MEVSLAVKPTLLSKVAQKVSSGLLQKEEAFMKEWSVIVIFRDLAGTSTKLMFTSAGGRREINTDIQGIWREVR